VGVQIPQILSVRTPKWFYIVRCKSIVTITGWIAGRQIIVKTTVCGGGLQTAAVSSCPISTLPVNFNPNQTDPWTDPSHAPFCFKHHDYLVSVQSHFSLTSDAKAKPKKNSVIYDCQGQIKPQGPHLPRRSYSYSAHVATRSWRVTLRTRHFLVAIYAGTLCANTCHKYSTRPQRPIRP